MANLAAQVEGLAVRDAPEFRRLFDIRAKPGTVSRYRVDIIDADKNVAFTRSESDQALRPVLWETNRGLMDVAFKESGGCFDGVVCVYNGSNDFYTNVPLDLPEDPEDGKQWRTFDLNDTEELESLLPSGIGDIPEMDLAPFPSILRHYFGPVPYVSVTITRERDIDFSANGGDALREGIRQFLLSAMLESTVNPLTDRSYYPLDTDRIFALPTPEQQVNDVVTLRSGLLLEPSSVIGTPNGLRASLEARLKYTPFYIEQSLEEALRAFPANEAGFDAFIKLVQGVRCHLQVDPTRSFVIDGWTEELICDTEFAGENGAPISMVDAVEDCCWGFDVNRRGIQVCKPWRSQCARPHGIVDYEAYPLEALRIMPNQRVPKSQRSEDLHRLIQSRVDAIDEHEPRQEALDRCLNEVLFSEAAGQILSAFGVTVSKKFPL